MYRDFMNADGLADLDDMDYLLMKKAEILRPILETTSRYIWKNRRFFAAALIGAEGIVNPNVHGDDWWFDYDSTEKFLTTLEVLREKASFA